MPFAFYIMACKRNIILTASNKMMIARDRVTFAYGIMVCIRNII